MPAVNICTSSNTTNGPIGVGEGSMRVSPYLIPTTKYTTIATPVNNTLPGIPSR